MADKAILNTPIESDTYLRDIRDVVMCIRDILQSERDNSVSERRVKSQEDEDLWLNKDIVLAQLKISASTLAKWRSRKCIKYKSQGQKLLVYNYGDLLKALSSNRLTARGFDPFAAYKRLIEWRNKFMECNWR